jgi:hypothetical protein
VNHCYFGYNTKLLEMTLMHTGAQSLTNGQKYSHQCPQVQAQDNPHCVVSTSCTHGSQQESRRIWCANIWTTTLENNNNRLKKHHENQSLKHRLAHACIPSSSQIQSLSPLLGMTNPSEKKKGKEYMVNSVMKNSYLQLYIAKVLHAIRST